MLTLNLGILLVSVLSLSILVCYLVRALAKTNVKSKPIMKNKSDSVIIDLKFEEIFKTIVFVLTWNGSYPFISRDVRWMLHCACFHGLNTAVIISVIYSTIAYVLKQKDLTQACGNCTLIVFYCIVTLKYSLLLIHQDTFKFLINKMKQDYDIANNTLPPEEKILLIDWTLKAKRCLKYWSYLVLWVSNSFMLRSIPKMIYLALMSEFRLVEYYPVTYPAPIERIKYNIVPFTCIYFSWMFVGYYVGSFYSGVVSLGPVFMMHACGQLELLKKRVMELFHDDTLTPDDRQKRFKYIINELQDVYDFVKKIEKCFSFLYEVVLKGSCVIMPVMLYEVIDSIQKRQPLSHPEFHTVFIATVIVTAIPCYYGDLLAEQGASFKNALYMSNWETLWDKRARKTLILMLTRSQSPVAVRAVFREINRDALADVYRQAYALFNFIIAAWT